MPYNTLLLPLLGGFIFIRLWNRTRYHAIRADKERIVIYAAIAGILFLGIAYLLRIAAGKLFPCGTYSGFELCFATFWKTYAPAFEYLDVSLLALAIGSTLWKPLNHLKRFDRTNEIDRVIIEDADPLELLLKRSEDENLAVSITLAGGKVYVGLVNHIINPATPTNRISLVPFQSGYRDEKTKEIVFTVNYTDTYARINQDIDKLEAKIVKIQKAKKSKSDTEKDTEISKLADESLRLKEGLRHVHCRHSR